jgi:hypothetical protein
MWRGHLRANGYDVSRGSSPTRWAAGPGWNAATDIDVRLQDVPLTNIRPDVVVYRAETIDVTPTRPEHVLLVAEVEPINFGSVAAAPARCPVGESAVTLTV